MPVLTIRDLRILNLPQIDLEVLPGTIVTLSGTSGIGKTLFLRAIIDLDLNEGEVQLGESHRNATPAPAWRRLVGFLPAESSWWHDSVGEHFDDGQRAPLESLGLEQTCLDWQVSRLSSGERQRLALARLLAQRPKALLLDEPTANLDNANSERVEVLIRQYCSEEQVPVVWVSHDRTQCQRIGQRHLELDRTGLRESPWN
jgi:ABC-type iron transport system FetAB ATPase subunit